VQRSLHEVRIDVSVAAAPQHAPPARASAAPDLRWHGAAHAEALARARRETWPAPPAMWPPGYQPPGEPDVALRQPVQHVQVRSFDVVRKWLQHAELPGAPPPQEAYSERHEHDARYFPAPLPTELPAPAWVHAPQHTAVDCGAAPTARLLDEQYSMCATKQRAACWGPPCEPAWHATQDHYQNQPPAAQWQACDEWPQALQPSQFPWPESGFTPDRQSEWQQPQRAAAERMGCHRQQQQHDFAAASGAAHHAAHAAAHAAGRGAFSAHAPAAGWRQRADPPTAGLAWAAHWQPAPEHVMPQHGFAASAHAAAVPTRHSLAPAAHGQQLEDQAAQQYAAAEVITGTATGFDFRPPGFGLFGGVHHV